MKQLIILVLVVLITSATNAQSASKSVSVPDSTKKILTVDASCGLCQFGLKGKGCELAVRMEGKSYYVDGTKIDDHGDAHASDGFCSAIRKAEVQGELINERYRVTYFRLLKAEPKKEPAKNQ